MHSLYRQLFGRKWFLILLAMPIGWGSTARCEELTFRPAVSDELQELARYAWAGQTQSREQFSSGVFTATGRMSSKDSIQGEMNGDVLIECAVDHGKESIRFMRKEPVRMTSLDDDPKGWEREVIQSEYMAVPGHLYEWSSVSMSELRIHDPLQAPGGRSAAPFDVRTFGLSFPSGIQKNISFEEIREVIRTQEISEVAEETNSLLRVSWMLGDDDEFKRTIWFDSQRGYSPIRLEAWRRPAGESTWSLKKIECDVGWTQINEVWVPTTFAFEGRMDTAKSIAYQLLLEWSSVNEPIDDIHFKPESLSAPDHARVVDLRLGQPVTLGRLRSPTHQVTKQNLNTVGIDPPWRRMILLVGNAVLIVVLAIGFFVRKRKMASQR